MEAPLTEHSEHRSATSDNISGHVTPTRDAKRKRITSSVSEIPSDMNECVEFENFPREIMVEIMSRLPTQSLMRFKSLNKSWYFFIRCLIIDSKFVAKHQSRAESHPTVLLFNDPIPCYDGWPGDEDLPAVPPQRVFLKLLTDFVETAGEKGEIGCVAKDIDVSHLPSSLVRRRLSRFIEVYHCNGFVFLTNDRWAVTLYFPAMNVFSTFEPKSDVEVDRESEILAMGFGSDFGATSFKFVRILSSMNAQVYDPGHFENSWREIEFSVCKNKLRYIFRHVYVRGYIFWLLEYSGLCLCFDVTKESFQIVEPSDEMRANELVYSILAAREDSLWLFSFSIEKHVDVWLIDIGDGSFTWRKWMRIECFPGGFCSLVRFWGSDKLLLSTGRNDVMSYDIHTKEYKKLTVNRIHGNIHYVGPYVNTLASMKWMIKHVR